MQIVYVAVSRFPFWLVDDRTRVRKNEQWIRENLTLNCYGNVNGKSEDFSNQYRLVNLESAHKNESNIQTS